MEQQPQQEGAKRKRRRNRKKASNPASSTSSPQPASSYPAADVDLGESSSSSSIEASSSTFVEEGGPKKWASLFPAEPSTSAPTPQKTQTDFSRLRVANSQDLVQFQQQIENISNLNSNPPCATRKGLINRGSTCFINSIVQALFSLPSFAKALSTLTATRIPEASLPVLSIFLKLSSILNPRPKKIKEEEKKPNPTSPVSQPPPTNPTSTSKPNPNANANTNTKAKANPNSKPNPKPNPNSKSNPNSKTNPNSKPKPTNTINPTSPNKKGKEQNEWLSEKKNEPTPTPSTGSAWSKRGGVGGGGGGKVIDGECYGGEKMDRYVSCMVGRELVDVSELFSPLLPDFDPELRSLAKRFNKHEDAHEFLEFLLNKLHDELVSFQKATSSSTPPTTDSSFLDVQEAGLEVEEWSTMRRKGKGSASVVTLNLAKSPISGGFGVNIRHSRVNRRGKSTISATSQPYYVLPLDIRFFNTVEAALDGFLGRGGEVEGFGRGGSEVVEKLQIESLPTILVLQLKRFWFNERTGYCEKISHPVSFPSRLVLDKQWFAPNAMKPNISLNYDLVSAVSHHGMMAGKGHYTCAARHQTGWVNMDDTNILPTDLRTISNHTAYLLFYQVVPNKKT